MRNLSLKSNLELIKKLPGWRYVQEALNSQEVRINCNTLRETGRVLWYPEANRCQSFSHDFPVFAFVWHFGFFGWLFH